MKTPATFFDIQHPEVRRTCAFYAAQRAVYSRLDDRRWEKVLRDIRKSDPVVFPFIEAVADWIDGGRLTLDAGPDLSRTLAGAPCDRTDPKTLKLPVKAVALCGDLPDGPERLLVFHDGNSLKAARFQDGPDGIPLGAVFPIVGAATPDGALDFESRVEDIFNASVGIDGLPTPIQRLGKSDPVRVAGVEIAGEVVRLVVNALALANRPGFRADPNPRAEALANDAVQISRVLDPKRRARRFDAHVRASAEPGLATVVRLVGPGEN